MYYYWIIIELLDEINDAYVIDDISNKKSILLFFRQSFYKICDFYNLVPSESMKKNIDSKLIINELNYPINETNNKESEQFVGALPIKIPKATTVSSNIDKYARGLVNPLQRETINNILTPTKVIGFNPESTLDLVGTKIFLLEVTDFNNNAPAVLKYNTNDRHRFNIKDVLAQLPNKKSTSSVISEDSSDRIFKNRKYFGPVKLQKLRIRLLDENGKVVNLNDSEMIISFDIEMLDMPYKNKE